MEELIKIADTYQGDQNVTVFYPHASEYSFAKLFLEADIDGSEIDDVEKREIRRQRKMILYALFYAYNDACDDIHYNNVSPMGLILYGGIKRCSSGYQIDVERYEPKNNPLTKSLFLIGREHHLRDHDDTKQIENDEIVPSFLEDDPDIKPNKNGMVRIVLREMFDRVKRIFGETLAREKLGLPPNDNSDN
jgi:hypothetical protein